MEIEGWKYYNHAAIPTCAPHEQPDLVPIKNGTIWKINGGMPFFARWTSDLDCGYKTNWWYVICKKPYCFEKLSKNSRKSIRKAINNCEVRIIDPTVYYKDLWRVYCEAIERYKNPVEHIDKESFINSCKNTPTNYDYWAGFDKETGRMIGWMSCIRKESYIMLVSSKYSTEFMKKRVSDAINHTVLDYYLMQNDKYQYVVNGERSISHDTNVQEYYVEHFKFEYAYCKLHIEYNPKIEWVIKLIYPFRRILLKLNGIRIIHQLNSVLKMEELIRSQ